MPIQLDYDISRERFEQALALFVIADDVAAHRVSGGVRDRAIELRSGGGLAEHLVEPGVEGVPVEVEQQVAKPCGERLTELDTQPRLRDRSIPASAGAAASPRAIRVRRACPASVRLRHGP
jgi:hypothetical protein